FFFFQAEDGIRYRNVTGVQTCALPILNDLNIKTDLQYSTLKIRFYIEVIQKAHQCLDIRDFRKPLQDHLSFFSHQRSRNECYCTVLRAADFDFAGERSASSDFYHFFTHNPSPYTLDPSIGT